MLTYVLTAIFLLLQVYLIFRSRRLAKQVGDVILKGSTIYKKLIPNLLSGLSLAIFFINMLNHMFLGGILIMFVIVTVSTTMSERDYLGEHGLKSKLMFIPREKLIGYELVEVVGKEVRLSLADSPDEVVRFRITAKASSDSLEKILGDYFGPDKSAAPLTTSKEYV